MDKNKTNKMSRKWCEEWDATVEMFQDLTGVDELLQKEWDETVRPFHRRKAYV